MLGIVIITYNIPSAVFLLQVQALQKFCKDEFVIEVIDNSTDLELAEHVRYHSSHLGLNYTKTFSGSKNSSDSHSFAANFAYQKFKDTYKYFFFIDHDCLPVTEFSVIEILSGGHVMAGLGQGKLRPYFWPGCVMFNNSSIDQDLIDFSANNEFGLDTGGQLWEIVRKHGEDCCIFFNETYHENSQYRGKAYKHYAMINNQMFMHFVNSSNWNNQGDNQERISSLINIAKDLTGL